MMLSFTFRKNKSENVVEYSSRRRSTFKKSNASRVEP